jgi:tetratricopeptide (TPR) repeat protein
MSKPMVVTLPVIMILLDYWPLKRFESKKSNWVLWQLKEKIPFFVLSAVFSIITLYAQYKPFVKDFPLSSRLANAPVSFVTYLEKTFWPHDLAVFYPFSDQLLVWQVLGAALLILVISVAVIAAVKRLPYLFAGWLWYVITLLPVIGIIQVGDFAMADRYHYLPSIGIGIMLAWGIPLLFKREDIRQKILFPAGIAILAILAFLSWQQCGYWKNSTTLFSHALQVTKDNYVANNCLASALFNEGKIEEAIIHYNKAIRIIPYYASAYCNRGIAYTALGQYQRAIEDYNKAIRLQPDLALVYYNRGNTFSNLGRYQLAVEDFNEAIRRKPDNAVFYYNRGSAYFKFGKYQRAVEDFNEAIRRKPDDANSYNNRGGVYLIQGNKKLGCYDAQKACKLGN